MAGKGSWIFAITLIVLVASCGGDNATAPATPSYSLGAADAPIVFVKAIPILPGVNYALIGFDISFVDAGNRAYYLAAPEYAGVITLDLDSISSSVPKTSILSPSGPISFSGTQTDVNDPNAFPGGPNGVVTANKGTELWAADANTYDGNVVNGVPSNLADYSNDNCDSDVKIITLATKSVAAVKTNGCFKSDELAYDPDDNLVLVANPDEKPNGGGYTGTTGTVFAVNIPASARKAGVPTGPFISLIDASGKTVLEQIAFDGTNGTPDATGGIEQPLYSAAMKRFYIAVPSDGLGGFGNPDANGAIAIVDPATHAVSKFPLTNCHPNGMTLGPDGKEVFLACNSSTGPQVVSLVDGTLLSASNQFAAANAAPTDSASLSVWDALAPYGAQYACDETWFNSALNKYLAVCNFSYNNANLTVVDAGDGIPVPGNSASSPQILSVNTNALASLGASHSVASDATSGAIIVPLPVGDPLCANVGGNGCIGVWAPLGSTLQTAAQ